MWEILGDDSLYPFFTYRNSIMRLTSRLFFKSIPFHLVLVMGVAPLIKRDAECYGTGRSFWVSP
jgi:hypothetical protein